MACAWSGTNNASVVNQNRSLQAACIRSFFGFAASFASGVAAIGENHQKK
jgi:hypothetical protein